MLSGCFLLLPFFSLIVFLIFLFRVIQFFLRFGSEFLSYISLLPFFEVDLTVLYWWGNRFNLSIALGFEIIKEYILVLHAENDFTCVWLHSIDFEYVEFQYFSCFPVGHKMRKSEDSHFERQAVVQFCFSFILFLD